MTKKTKEKISNSLKGRTSGKCKDPIKELERKRKISKAMKGNTNWMFNKKHGNSKQGWYKGIHCDSSWELAFLVYYIEHNMNIKRCDIKYDFIWENSIHKYIPDFITDEGIIEIKGRKSKKSLEKEKQFPNVKVIDEHLIKPYLDYVKQKYGNDFWIKLYDNGDEYKKCKKIKQIKNNKNKEELFNKRKNILINACKNSNIDFTKFGWSEKLKNYLKNKNELFDNIIYRSLKKYYKEFFDIYKPFIRSSVKKNE